MKSALLLIPLLAVLAFAQEPAVRPPVRIESVRTSVQGGEVRIDIETSAPIDSPGSAAPYADELILDLPGVIYDRMGQRIQVNKADVRDVRVWMQQQKPPIARVSVGMTRDKAYSLSAEGNHLILRIGPWLQTAAARNARTRPKQEAMTVIPAGRASRGVPGTVGAIFTREPRQPVPISRRESTNNSAEQNESRAPLPPIRIDEITKRSAGRAATGEVPAVTAADATPSLVEKEVSPPAPAPAVFGRDAAPSPSIVSTSAPEVSVSSPKNAGSSATPEPAGITISAATPSPRAVNSAAESARRSAAPVVTTAIAPASTPPALPVGPATEPGTGTAARTPSPDIVPAVTPAIPAASAVAEPAASNAVPTAGSAVSDVTPSITAARAVPEVAVSNAPPAPAAVVAPALTPPAAAASETLEASAASREPTPAIAGGLAATPPVPNAGIRTLFHVKFVQQETAYIDGGRTAGLTEGMKLLVSSPDADGGLPKGMSSEAAVAELVVVGIAETSAVTEVRTPKRDVTPGDLAYFTDTDLQALVQQHSLSSTRKYPVVISFTEEDDALDAEARVVDVPRAPLPSVNRMQGRFGFDYIGTQTLGRSQSSGKDVGVVIRADFTRMGGTYWNFRGYWRGRVDYLSAGTQPTLQELINRTYHLALTYDNPTGHWVAGVGRLLLPWASSLDTIDGGYFGRRVRPGVITGVFAGSTPDPTSWNYNPHRQIAGTFVNLTGGSFEAVHYSSTTGAGINLLSWHTDRPMIFFENSVSYRRNFSIYHSLQADSPAGNAATTAPGPGIGRSFLTVRWSPIPRLDLDFNHTYFRNVPTFDPRLIGTGLLDKYLFQGFSGGGRVGIVKQISVYAELGRSNRSGDNSKALNSLYGVTWGKVPWLDVRADAHYSRFNSSFGSGSYRAVSLTRSFRENVRLDVMGGTQTFISTLAGNQNAKFLTTTVDSNLGSTLFVQGGFTVYRGQQQNYNQWMLMMGYRFDSKWKRR